MLTRTQKEEQVDELRQKFGKSTGLFIADYRGIDVQSINQLRSQLKNGDDPNAFEYRVTKNSLLRRAAEGLPVAEALGQLKGPTAIAFSYGDSIGLAKILVDFAGEHEVFEIKGGVVDGAAVDREFIAELAALPSMDELRGKLVGLLTASAQKLVQVLVAPASQLARLTDARRAQLEESGGTSE